MTIAEELGVTAMTVKRWIAMARAATARSTPHHARSTPPTRATPPTPRLKPVRVEGASPSTSGRIVATTREGLRIEGLTVADVVTLLQALA